MQNASEGSGDRGSRSQGDSGVILGVYPMLFHASGADERELYEALAADRRVAGLEVPFGFDTDPQRWEGLLASIPDHWSIVLTTIPSTMTTLAADASYGLASKDAAGRSRALDHARQAAAESRRLNDRFGRALVAAVELHSAPRAGDSSATDLTASLDELSLANWGGARMLLEHCDAATSGFTPAKGFLSLEEELSAIEGLPVGIVLNWARSAIEFRDADRVVEHIELARSAGALDGLIFSGVAGVDGPLGAAWNDGHLPFAATEPQSLLTAERAEIALAAAGPVGYLGAKLSWKGEQSTSSRMTALLDALDILAPSTATAR